MTQAGSLDVHQPPRLTLRQTASLLAAIICWLGTAPVPTAAQTATPQRAPKAAAAGKAVAIDPHSAFLQVAGPQIIYRGEAVRLRGINHNNIPALCARSAKFNFGSCKIDDINIGEEDYRRMGELGLNHVRFGLSYRWYRDDRVKFFRVLDAHVAMARRHRLWIVWNLFTTPGDCYEGYTNQCPFWGNPSEHAQFKAFWVDMARHYAAEPAVAAYGLLNEPTPPFWANWTDMAEQVAKAVTEANPRAIVAVGSTSSARFNRVLKLTNILYEVHDYLPMALTHAETGDVRYPGEVPDWDGTRVHWSKDSLQGRGHARANLVERLSIGWARSQGVPLYIGEWGTTNVFPGYIDLVRDRAELYTKVFDVHHAFYTWRSDAKMFGLFPYTGPLTPHSQELVEAAAASWSGVQRPSY